MIVATYNTTINFNNVIAMGVENKFLIFEFGDFQYQITFDSLEQAHQARRLIESAYVHGEKICKLRK